MALKGVCEIQLKDVDGNVVQETKDYNMVTNALDRLINIDTVKLCELTGGISMGLVTNKLSIIRKMIGGCLLFNKTLEEDVNNIIPPSQGSIVASGCLAKTPLDNNKIGNWNIEESQVVYNSKGEISGFKFVWDFATNIGNGTIKSVSLTTDEAARYIKGSWYLWHFSNGGNGLSRPYNLIDPIEEKTKGGQVDFSNKYPYDTDFYNNQGYLLGSLEENTTLNFIDAVSSTRGVILSKRIKRNTIKLNDTYFGEGTYVDDVVKSYSLTDMEAFPSSMSSSSYKSVIYGITYLYDNYVYIAYGFKNKISIKKIDALTLEEIETVNKTFTEGNIHFYNNYMTGRETPCVIFVYKNYYVFPTYVDYKIYLYVVNKDDLLVIKKIEIGGSINMSSVYAHSYFNNKLYISYSSGGNNYCYSVEEVGEGIDILKESLFIYQDTKMQFKSIKYPLTLFKHAPSGGGNNPSIVIDKSGYNVAMSANVLFTIDNLATPVTKTASQTMKVIYTIQDVEEEVV